MKKLLSLSLLLLVLCSAVHADKAPVDQWHAKKIREIHKIHGK